jgi:hypothetical protein
LARKNRNLASFDDVASINENNKDNVNNEFKINENNDDNVNINNEFKINENNNIDVKINDTVDKNNSVQSNNKRTSRIDELFNTQGHEDKYIMKGLYIEKDLALLLDSLGKQHGRGAKSKIVNDALRQFFSEEGYI